MKRVWLLASTLVLGCGAKVVFDGEEGGSSGAGDGAGVGASSGQGADGSGASGQGAGSSSAELDVACDRFCHTIPQCANLDFCPSGCDAYHIPGCETQGATLLDCLSDHLDVNCVTQQGDCFSQTAAFQNCIGDHSCGDEACIDEGGVCECAGSCGGQEASLHCEPEGDAVHCYCDRGSESFDCLQSSGACSLAESCCAEFFLQ